MRKTTCGLDCDECEINKECKGCVETEGKPFGGDCILANCCKDKEMSSCDKCKKDTCSLEEKLVNEFNSLGIKDMGKISGLNALQGAFVNLEYPLTNGQSIKLLKDQNIYLGNQICKADGRCYGLVADENILLVCEYGEDGADPEIILYKKRTK